MYAVNGQSLKATGRIEIQLKVNGLKLDTSMLVVGDIAKPTLGLDWLRQHRVAWEFETDTVVISGVEVPLMLRTCADASDKRADARWRVMQRR